jgi:hypothetical protein
VTQSQDGDLLDIRIILDIEQCFELSMEHQQPR